MAAINDIFPMMTRSEVYTAATSLINNYVNFQLGKSRKSVTTMQDPTVVRLATYNLSYLQNYALKDLLTNWPRHLQPTNAMLATDIYKNNFFRH